MGTGAAVNPYYDSPNGLSVGAVDVNPLVSFQATTGEDGQLVTKPLINLHVVPNGCGILGCDYDDEYNGYNRKQSGAGGLLGFLFPKKKRHPGGYDHQSSGFSPSQPYVPHQNNFAGHYADKRDQYYQDTYYRPNYQQPQPQPQPQPVYQQPTYEQTPVYQQQQPVYQQPATSTKTIAFHNDDEKVVRHEHHHFHHHSAAPNQNNNNNNGYLRSGESQANAGGGGISFGYNRYGGVYGRTADSGEDIGEEEEEEDVETTNNVKRNIFGEEDKSSKTTVVGSVETVPIESARLTEQKEGGQEKTSVRFPQGRSLDRKRRSPEDSVAEEPKEKRESSDKLSSPAQEEQVLPVRFCRTIFVP